MFWIIKPCRIYDFQYVLPFCGVSFHSLDSVLGCTKDFTFDKVQFIYLFLVLLVPVFLSYWLFGLRRSALEFAGSWIQPGVGAKMRTSGRPHSD